MLQRVILTLSILVSLTYLGCPPIKSSSVIIVAATASEQRRLDIADGYKKINELLITELPNNEDPEDNLRFALDKLATMFPELEVPFAWPKSWLPYKVDLNFRQALSELTDLLHITSAKNCTKYDKLFMKNVAEQTGAHRYSAKPEKEFNRVGRIVYRVSREQAERCKQIWPQTFKEQYPKFNRTMIRLAEGPRRQQLAKKPEMTNRQYIEWLIDYEPLSNPEEVNCTIKFIKKCSHLDPNSHNARYMLKKYLSNPCRQYLTTIGKSSVEQAEFGAEMFRAKDGYMILDDDSDSENLILFYQTLAYFKFCRKISYNNNNDFRSKVLAKLKTKGAVTCLL